MAPTQWNKVSEFHKPWYSTMKFASSHLRFTSGFVIGLPSTWLSLSAVTSVCLSAVLACLPSPALLFHPGQRSSAKIALGSLIVKMLSRSYSRSLEWKYSESKHQHEIKAQYLSNEKYNSSWIDKKLIKKKTAQKKYSALMMPVFFLNSRKKSQ